MTRIGLGVPGLILFLVKDRRLCFSLWWGFRRTTQGHDDETVHLNEISETQRLLRASHKEPKQALIFRKRQPIRVPREP